ncbi:MAG: hypothetical protein LBE11_02935 [Prevotellaceae bacterium]|jgi:hypothetical protein|nr:hypothetical protein [Prevotellaceae bacterium]
MKKIFLILGMTVATMSVAQNEIDFSSVDEFFKLADKLETGIEPTDEEWKQFFDSHGYSVSAGKSPLRKKIIMKMMNAAFNPNCQSLQDSVFTLFYEKIMDNPELMLSKMTLENYLDMKNHFLELKTFRNSDIFKTIEADAKNRLREFLVNPVDSLIIIPSISVLCYEYEGQSKDNGIVMDLNLLYKLSYLGTVDFLAHEMFHTYRRNFTNQNFPKISEFTNQLDHLQDEAIADLIDKKENIWETLSMKGLPAPIADMYIETYNSTPLILARLDSIICSFTDNKITTEQFNKEIKNYFFFGGHPNGYYMAKLIKNAGFEDELKKYFYNPVAFIKLYNKVAKIRSEYVFSEKFISYLEDMK